ncbi:MAG: hypothetical protein J1D85_08395 [Bacteroidales bacterium]|nr:hypothetical protein [Bacteroidales bacterium]
MKSDRGSCDAPLLLIFLDVCRAGHELFSCLISKIPLFKKKALAHTIGQELLFSRERFLSAGNALRNGISGLKFKNVPCESLDTLSKARIWNEWNGFSEAFLQSKFTPSA